MFWKASSTLLASKADVSMNDRLFSPWEWHCQRHEPLTTTVSESSSCRGIHTGKLLGFLGRHRPQMPQIALVADQHDDNVGVGVVAELLQPPRHVLVCLVLADVVDEQGADSATVVCRRDGPVPLLARRVPNLCLDGFGIHLDGPRGELDADGRLGVEVEFIAREPAQQVGLANARVSDQYNCFGELASGRGEQRGRGSGPLKRNCRHTRVSTQLCSSGEHETGGTRTSYSSLAMVAVAEGGGYGGLCVCGAARRAGKSKRSGRSGQARNQRRLR